MRVFLQKSFIFFLVLFVAAISGCGVITHNYLVKQPAQIGMKGHKRIALGTFSGTDTGHADTVMNNVSANLIDSGYFDAVMDRKYLSDIIDEHKLQLSGMMDETSIVRLGKFTGAAAYIYGNLDMDSYTEGVTREEVTTSVTNTRVIIHDQNHTNVEQEIYQKKTHHFQRTGQYDLRVSFKIVDIQTAKLIAVKVIPTRRQETTQSIDERPPAIDQDRLFTSCAEEVSTVFARMLYPTTIEISTELETDGDLPDVEKAFNQIKVGNNSAGEKMFRDMTQKTGLKPEILAKTFYNLGEALVISGSYDDGIMNIKKALSLNPNQGRYSTALDRAKELKENARQLKNQEQD